VVINGDSSLNFGRAEIGIILAIVYPFFTLFSVWGVFFMPWIVFFNQTLGLVFFLLTATSSLLYFSDRKGFLQRRKGSGNVSVLLTILGFILIAESVLSGFFSLMWSDGLTIRTMEELVSFLFALSLLGLPFILGIQWLTDGSRVLEEKLGALERKTNFEETLKRYPKDLFAKYVEKHPHNPEGVLEWHIHKKMKEGKTREQAINELLQTY